MVVWSMLMPCCKVHSWWSLLLERNQWRLWRSGCAWKNCAFWTTDNWLHRGSMEGRRSRWSHHQATDGSSCCLSATGSCSQQVPVDQYPLTTLSRSLCTTMAGSSHPSNTRHVLQSNITVKPPVVMDGSGLKAQAQPDWALKLGLWQNDFFLQVAQKSERWL